MISVAEKMKLEALAQALEALGRDHEAATYRALTQVNTIREFCEVTGKDEASILREVIRRLRQLGQWGVRQSSKNPRIV